MDENGPIHASLGGKWKISPFYPPFWPLVPIIAPHSCAYNYNTRTGFRVHKKTWGSRVLSSALLDMVWLYSAVYSEHICWTNSRVHAVHTGHQPSQLASSRARLGCWAQLGAPPPSPPQLQLKWSLVNQVWIFSISLLPGFLLAACFKTNKTVWCADVLKV